MHCKYTLLFYFLISLLDVEVVFVSLQIMEEMVQDTCQYLLTSSEAELDFYLQRQGSQQHKVTVLCGYHGPVEFVTCRILEMF